jgi:hypothetical protein
VTLWNNIKTGKLKDLEKMSHCHFVKNKSHIDCPGIKPLLFSLRRQQAHSIRLRKYSQSNASQKAIKFFVVLLL